MRCAEIALPGKTYATYSWNIIFLRRAFYVMDPKCRRKGGVIVGETLFSQKSLIVRKQNTSENVKKLILFLKNKKKSVPQQIFPVCAKGETFRKTIHKKCRLNNVRVRECWCIFRVSNTARCSESLLEMNTRRRVWRIRDLAMLKNRILPIRFIANPRKAVRRRALLEVAI